MRPAPPPPKIFVLNWFLFWRKEYFQLEFSDYVFKYLTAEQLTEYDGHKVECSFSWLFESFLSVCKLVLVY